MRVLALFLALVVTASAADVKIVRVFSGWRDAASFKRISEYFTGRENSGNEVVVRTRPGERGGYYFLVRTDNRGAATPAKFVFHVVLPDAPEPRTFSFLADLPAGKTVFNLGVTGADWPDAQIDAVAWKLDVLTAAGEPLAVEKSYLWEKPGK